MQEGGDFAHGRRCRTGMQEVSDFADGRQCRSDMQAAGISAAGQGGKRKADASSTPHDSPDKLPKRGSKKTKRSDASFQSSSSEDDEESVTGAVETEKSKLARRTSLQSV